ncbi:MAG: TetR/AcrR family transcriptional regulator [Bacteroidetes bacterium]|nr:TetR/AcrR family transcriptional regulator [Bacteroidota bacterium]
MKRVYQDMVLNGFKGTRPDKVIKQLGITKGALYHYFPSKEALGYAVIEEILQPSIVSNWEPLKSFPENPVDFLLGGINIMKETLTKKSISLGSPLSKLIQEMAPLDDGFRRRLHKIVDEIHKIVSDALKQGQRKGQVKKHIDADKIAYFILSCLEGSYIHAKVSKSKDIFNNNLECLSEYLKLLKA